MPVEIVVDYAPDDVTLAVNGKETEFERLPSGNLGSSSKQVSSRPRERST